MSHTEDDQRAGWIDRFVELFPGLWAMTLPASSTPRLLETCQFRLTGDEGGAWVVLLDFGCHCGGHWVSIWKQNKRFEWIPCFFSWRNVHGVCPFVHLFWQNIPPQLATCSTGGLHYNRRDEFNLQIITNLHEMSFTLQKKKQKHHSLALYSQKTPLLWCCPSKHLAKRGERLLQRGWFGVLCASRGDPFLISLRRRKSRWSRFRFLFFEKPSRGGRNNIQREKCG